MSGIFGFYDPDQRLPADAAERMADVLAMAPGCRAIVCGSPTMQIGVVDKGILPGSGQVLASLNGERRAVFQGEILSLGNAGDDEDAVARARRLLCRPLSDELLARASGPFAAAILDETQQAIELTGDRFGRYLTFYAQVGRTVVFASQIKALLATGIVASDLDEDALGLMLSIGEVVGDLTLLRCVRAIPAACVARIDAGGIRFRRYWNYRYDGRTEMGFSEAAVRAGSLLKRAVGRICATHDALGVPLSGGLDSRVLLAACPDPTRVRSYTWGIAGCRDIRYATRTAATLRSPHESHVYDPAYIARLGERGVWLTEGLCDLADMHVLPYVEHVATSSRVLLDGLAGDAILGGNFIKRDWWSARSPQEAAAALWNWRAGMLGPETGGALLGAERYDDLTRRSRACFEAAYAASEGDDEMSRAMAFLLDNRVRRCSCSGTHLFRWRLELHSPFFDNDFFDHVASLPHAWRFRHRLYIEMIRRCFPVIAHIPWQRTGLPARSGWPARFVSAAAHRINARLSRRIPRLDVLPGRHVSRFDLWFRGPLRPFIREILLSERFLSRGLVRADGVRHILCEHDAGANHSKLIGVLAALELFLRLFIDDFPRAATRSSVPFSGKLTRLPSVPTGMVA